jgi:hypothetical protein
MRGIFRKTVIVSGTIPASIQAMPVADLESDL